MVGGSLLPICTWVAIQCGESEPRFIVRFQKLWLQLSSRQPYLFRAGEVFDEVADLFDGENRGLEGAQKVGDRPLEALPGQQLNLSPCLFLSKGNINSLKENTPLLWGKALQLDNIRTEFFKVILKNSR